MCSCKRRDHLRRERRSGLAALKKRRFTEQHGYLFCERCKTVPSKELGPNGDACIEVHHATIAISKMGNGVRTRFSDLQCLCANSIASCTASSSLERAQPIILSDGADRFAQQVEIQRKLSYKTARD